MINQLNHKYEARIIQAEQNLIDLQKQIKNDGSDLSSFIRKSTDILLSSLAFEKEWSKSFYESRSIEELKALNLQQNKELLPENYNSSYANPDVCQECFGQELGKVICYIYQKARLSIPYAYEHRRVSIMWLSEMLIDIITSLVEDPNRKVSELVEKIKSHAMMDIKDKLRLRIYRSFDPDFDTYNQMIEKPEYEDEKYLYKYGLYVSDNEQKLFDYFQKTDETKLQKMADTFTQAYMRGYKRNEVDIKPKKSIQIAYQVGFEPVMHKVVNNFNAYGLKPIVRYDLEGSLRPRLIHTLPNPQNFFDHRFDEALFADEAYYEYLMAHWKEVFDEFESTIKAYAGPAVMEVFGETSFEPEMKDSSIRFTDNQQSFKQKYTGEYQALFSRYLPNSQWSFTINAYPLPSIGKQFEEIFDETIIVNTLDEEMYRRIQQTMIETLDLGKSVLVTGRNGNRTHLLVQLKELKDPSCETNFNNCTADVNVPVGEVFTTPKLEGTVGTLHVKEVYLNGLKYKDLEIEFMDGMMTDYRCNNYADQAKNREYIRANITEPHTFLPIGEFAIGTNTKAYAMARKFNIEKILPILIGEKTGPHFAVGDTCYKWSEDVPVKNPDGREIVARDNSISCQRKTDIDKAYYYRHTDITIPYHELDAIIVITEDNKQIPIIQNGRFVLEGTKDLNDPLDEIEV